ncbi:uncharacterized protein [Henckelia pumila]|uniref:uncharacterized protein n=1 Tax=Henckelia pumila TaxID=405737 RepID=UPI003C6E3DC3
MTKYIATLGQSFVDIEKEGCTPEKANMDVFKGRVDFCGCEEAPDEEKKLVIDFLAREILDVIVWQNECLRLTGPQFCPFLFLEPVESEIINVYMIIMQKKSIDYGFEIYCMDTIVQREVLQNLEKYGKHRILYNTDYEVFLSRLTSFTRCRLQGLNKDLFRRCKYVIFPINDNWHWYLLVYEASSRTFKVLDSMHDPMAMRTARVYTKFLASCIKHLSGFEIFSEPVVREPCRDQGATLDCGVYTCMWLECLARDTVDMWKYAEDVKMDTYRARIAATILSDENGLLKNKFE